MFEIDRIAIHNLFGIQGLDVAWYGITMAAAILVGVWVACWQARKKGYKADLILDYIILAIPIGIIGARLYYVAFEWEYYSQHPEEILAIWNGGIAMYGSVIGGCIAGIILCIWRKFPFGRLMDFVGPGVVMGQAIGRWGNFFNQEAFGNIVTDPALQWFPYAVYVQYRDAGHGLIVQDSWVQATFFYESVWDLGVFFLLIWYAKRAKHDGNVFAMYLAAYGLGRFWIEGLRVSTLQLWPGMPVSQFLSLILMIGGVLYILIMHVKNPPNRVYEGVYCLDYEDEKDNGKKSKRKSQKNSSSIESKPETSATPHDETKTGNAESRPSHEQADENETDSDTESNEQEESASHNETQASTTAQNADALAADNKETASADKGDKDA